MSTTFFFGSIFFGFFATNAHGSGAPEAQRGLSQAGTDERKTNTEPDCLLMAKSVSDEKFNIVAFISQLILIGQS